MEEGSCIDGLTGLSTEEALEAGLVGKNAVQLILSVAHFDDFATEVFKSESAFTSIPEIGLEIPDGLSRYTNVSSLLEEIYDNLRKSPAMPGLDNFLNDLAKCLDGSMKFSLVISDALGLSGMTPPPHRQQQLKTVRKIRKASDDIYFGLKRPSVLELGEDSLKELTALIKAAQRVVILSGAGISTESGVPAFRSPDGMENIWDRYDPTLATFDAINREEKAREEYWSMHSELYELVFGDNLSAGGVKPNASHALAVELARQGKLQKVVTQNIDGLYLRAGLDASAQIEIHGTITTCRCGSCGLEHVRAEAHESWKSSPGPVKVPTCKACTHPLRFGTIAFGEPLPRHALEQAEEAIEACDLLLIMGTSLVVQPANKLPEIALDARVPVVLLNLGPTPLDQVVDLLVQQKCGITSQYVLDHLDDPDLPPPPARVHLDLSPAASQEPTPYERFLAAMASASSSGNAPASQFSFGQAAFASGAVSPALAKEHGGPSIDMVNAGICEGIALSQLRLAAYMFAASRR